VTGSGLCNPCASRRQREFKQRLKQRVFDMYGRRCACCGEDNEVFLCLDHVNDDGYLERYRGMGKGRGGNSVQYKAAGDVYRPDQWQILCHNCNYAKRFGICPHQLAATRV
jgi:hypothetical protein